MAKYSICIEPVLENLSFCDRIKAVADMGYDAFEFWDPTDKDIAAIARTSAAEKIPVSICCVKGAWQLRTNFPAKQVLDNFRESVKIAKELGCKSLICLSGDVEGKADSQKSILIENLKRCAEIAEKEDVTLCMEALNSLVDHKGYYLDSAFVGFEIMKCVGSDHVKLLYDVYHMQIMEGNILDTIKTNAEFIGHFHSAGTPGRHELADGELNYKKVIETVDATGYDRYFGLEYWPTYDDAQSLKDCLKHLKGE